MSAESAAERATPVAVEVTFLRMDRLPERPAPAFPPGAGVVVAERCTVGFYCYLYDAVGRDHCWWLRRTLPDAPRLTGTVRIVQGTWTGFGQKLEIERGTLVFSGPVDNPALDTAIAEYLRGDGEPFPADPSDFPRSPR